LTDSGGLSFDELHDGMPKLNLNPVIRFSRADWDVLTQDEKICNNLKEIPAVTFFGLVKKQLKDFMKRSIGARIKLASAADTSTDTILFMLKTLMFDEESGKIENAESGAGVGELKKQMEGLVKEVGEVTATRRAMAGMLRQRCGKLGGPAEAGGDAGDEAMDLLQQLKPGLRKNGPRNSGAKKV